MKLDEQVSIVGIGQSELVRRSRRSVEEMVVGAIRDAVADAGLELVDVDGIVTEGELVPQLVSANDVVANLGLADDLFAARAGFGGTGILGSTVVAAMVLRSGLATTVVSYFGLNWGSTNGAYGWHGQDPLKASLEMPFNFYGQPTYFAANARRYMHEYGLTEAQLGAVATTARSWANLNPAAQVQGPLGLDDYLAAPMIADPYRRYDCCLLSDGAVAFVMTTPERARDLRKPPVAVAACESSFPATSVHSFLTQHGTPLITQAAVTGPRAMAAAGIVPADVDFVNIYDCFTLSCLLQFEDLGFCEKGAAGRFFEEGGAGQGGALPVNPHGGMLSEAYLMGANNVIEAVRQLRGEAGARQVPGASVGVVSGLGAEQTTLVLTGAR
ncbi:MAG: hypothetical protein AB7L84_13805 [Acidimicrobiia bacterium]